MANGDKCLDGNSNHILEGAESGPGAEPRGSVVERTKASWNIQTSE
jgi:hypothetical protein